MNKFKVGDKVIIDFELYSGNNYHPITSLQIPTGYLEIDEVKECSHKSCYNCSDYVVYIFKGQINSGGWCNLNNSKYMKKYGEPAKPKEFKLKNSCLS